MKLGHFLIALCCLLSLTAGAGNCEDLKAADHPSAKQKEQPLVPTLPPPTAEWPDFPGPDASKVKPEAETTSTSVPEAVTPTPDAAATSVSPAPSLPPIQEQNPAQMEPHKRPVPAGYDAAAELYKQKKFPQAGKAFETIIQKGAANVDTHLSLAYCYLVQRLYSKAVKEFEWVAKYGKNSMTLQNQAGRTAISLRTYMAGVCPAPCLKANDPRWTLKADGKRWIKVQYSSKSARLISEYHVGEYVANINGDPVLKGACPVCGGTGQVAKLKDGDPPPRL